MMPIKEFMKRMVEETNEVLPSWEWAGFPQHPIAQIIEHSENKEVAIENLEALISDCRHQIGWINARRRNNCNEE